MRILIFILCVVFTFSKALCQEPVSSADSVNDELQDELDEPPPVSFAYYYAKGFDLYTEGRYSKAEVYYKKAFYKFKCIEAAENICRTLVAEGYGMEAETFRKQNKDFISDWPENKKTIEKVYLYSGPRICVTKGTSNVYYGNGGINIRLTDRIKLWQSVDYTTQDNNLGSFKQYGSFTHLDIYLGKGWYVNPSAAYAYTPYIMLTTQNRDVTLITDYTDIKNPISYQTNYAQNIDYTLNGISNSFNASVSINKRIHDLMFELEPSLHYIQSKSNGLYQYHSTGTNDSFVNNKLLGSAPYINSGFGQYDSSSGKEIGQLGLSLTYKWPVKFQKLTTRIAIFYLQDEEWHYAFAYHFYSLWQFRHDLWLHFSWANKGNLPWVLNYEGLYYNFTDQIKTRAGITLQLLPFKHFSPLLSYQYEQDIRSLDNATLTYHSLYLTLKYNL